jgi:hypothetical protein
MEGMRIRLNRLSQRLDRLGPEAGPAEPAARARKRIQVLRAQRDALGQVLDQLPAAEESSPSQQRVRREFDQAIGRLERLCDRVVARAKPEAWPTAGAQESGAGRSWTVVSGRQP